MSIYGSDLDYYAKYFGECEEHPEDTREMVSLARCELCDRDAPRIEDTVLYDMRTELSLHDRECPYRRWQESLPPARWTA